ncbi:putative virion-associated membrane protein [Cotonvirus japonicus]|uniref:Virion-associated membrane protein n=1 Tax=Cotonvirus japonicus TaxID=2811091 RepID=A0ABM7NTR9_9VIRU|nr:putative virion-associated membrane protein [Cotonvirus japonicus]BCS83563.1 putative virion-associated membrane protein [Cotonvirus japonicus]
MSQPIRWNDQVFICFPQADTGFKITSDTGSSDDGYVRPVASNGTILNGDPYIIRRPPNLSKVGNDPITNKTTIRLYRVNDSSNSCWYNGSGDQWVELRSNVSDNDSRPDWIIYALGAEDKDGAVINYGQTIRIVNSHQRYNVTYKSPADGGTTNFANISVGGVDSSNNSLIMFLSGDLDNAKLQCCRDNPVYTQPDYCGDFRGTTCSGQCDTILTDYCGIAKTTDPKCGCLLPASYYKVTGLLGPPECIDDRCVNQNTYRKSTQCKPNCNIINCVIDAKDIAGTNIDKVVFDQKCSGKSGTTPNGPGPTPTPNGPTTPGSDRSRLIWFILGGVIGLIILIIIIYLIYRAIKK